MAGINLGPTSKIAMSRLRERAGSLGFGDVATDITSGHAAGSRGPGTFRA